MAPPIAGMPSRPRGIVRAKRKLFFSSVTAAAIHGERFTTSDTPPKTRNVTGSPPICSMPVFTCGIFLISCQSIHPQARRRPAFPCSPL